MDMLDREVRLLSSIGAQPIKGPALAILLYTRQTVFETLYLLISHTEYKAQNFKSRLIFTRDLGKPLWTLRSQQLK